jgi:hypothetical protein
MHYHPAMRRSILILCLLAASARADESRLLARWAEAAGGLEHIRRIEALHAVFATDEDGMAGRREEWTTSALQRRERVDHTRDETVTVFDGRSGWRRDWNGFVEKLAGDDLRRQAGVALVHSFAALTGAAGPAKEVGPDTLELEPKDGSPLRLVLDPASGLPLRAELPSFDGTLTIAFSDWRPVDGILVPFAEKWTTGPNTTTAHLQSIDFIARDGVDLSPPPPGPDDVFFVRKATGSERLPFNFDNNHIMILAKVNGIGPIWFLVDTGANYSIINQSRLAELHLTPYGGLTTIGGGSSAAAGAYVDHLTYRFGDVELRDQHAAVLELRGLEKLYGMPLGGLLGYDFLSRFVTDIDYETKTLTIHPRTFDTSHLGGTTVPLVMQGEQPYCGGSITVGGRTIPAWFILDVGAADTITFTTPFVAANHLIELAGDKERTIRKFDAPEIEAFNPTNIRGLIDAVTIGGIVMPHVLVNLSAAKSGAYTSPAFSGNIGETILSRFAHVILDYRRSVMILRTRPSTTRPFEERKGFGLTVVSGSPDFHLFTVTAVGEHTGAADAGFTKGDVITAIDGLPASQMNLAAVKRSLGDDGTHHTFAVLRGTNELTLPATIRLTPVSGLR